MSNVIKLQSEKRFDSGFLMMPHAIDISLLASTLTKVQERVFRAILSKTLGYSKDTDCISTSQLSKIVATDERNVRRALESLEAMCMINRGRRTGCGTFLTPILDINKWNFANGLNQPEHIPERVKSTRTNGLNQPATKENKKINSNTSHYLSSTFTKKQKNDCPVDLIVEAYNRAVGDVPPRCLVLSDARKKAIIARYSEMRGTFKPGTDKPRFTTPDEAVEWFFWLFHKMRASEHYMGLSAGKWKANVDFAISPSGFLKILEMDITDKYRAEVKALRESIKNV